MGKKLGNNWWVKEGEKTGGKLGGKVRGETAGKSGGTQIGSTNLGGKLGEKLGVKRWETTNFYKADKTASETVRSIIMVLFTFLFMETQSSDLNLVLYFI